MTDNFKHLELYLNNENMLSTNEDVFYTIELISRGKDNPDKPAANYNFKTYYLYSVKDLYKFENEIKFLCKNLRLRAYISCEPKSVKKVALNTLAEVARRVANEDYRKLYKVYNSESSKNSIKGHKRWIVDVDDDNVGNLEVIAEIVDMCGGDGTIKLVNNTRSGFHLVTSPFNLANFKTTLEVNGLKNLEVKKNAITLLYEDL